MYEDHKNIINISIDGKAMAREMIREMSDNELDAFLNRIMSDAYINGLREGSAITLAIMREQMSEDDE